MDTSITLDMFTTEELELELELRRLISQLSDQQLYTEIQRRHCYANVYDLTGCRYGEIKVNDDGHIMDDLNDFQGIMILIPE